MGKIVAVVLSLLMATPQPIRMTTTYAEDNTSENAVVETAEPSADTDAQSSPAEVTAEADADLETGTAAEPSAEASASSESTEDQGPHAEASTTPDEADSEPTKPMKKARMLAASSEDLTGSAYAVFNSSTGELDFIRSTESHANGSSGTVKSISGGIYTGTIYANFENEQTAWSNEWPDNHPVPWNDKARTITTVKFVDVVKPLHLDDYFMNMSKLTSIDLSGLDTSSTTTMADLFCGCSSLKNIDLSSLNTAKVTNMQSMFERCNSLTSLDLSCFNTANVTDMDWMFNGCNNLTSLNVSNFNTANVTKMFAMFAGCSSLASLDVSKFNTTKVTNMTEMFEHCSSFTSLDVSGFDTANVTTMGSMFQDCNRLTSLDVSKFNTANVTSMSYMFDGCSNLTSLDVSKFNTANVTSMSYMFDGCSNLTSLDVSKFNTSNVTNMRSMFSGCSSLTSLDVSKFNTANVTNMKWMFTACRSLASLDVSGFDTAKVTDMGKMFTGCSSLTSLDVSKFNTAKVGSMWGMFEKCSNLKSLDVSGFITTKVVDISSMFDDCSSLTSLDVSNFNTANAMYMGSMFYNCGSITSLDVSKFDTAKVTNMRLMFCNCSRLTSLDVSNFNTAKVTDMEEMFADTPFLAKITFGKGFKVPINRINMFASPTTTFSGKASIGTWGLDSETASSSKTAEELAKYGTTAGNLTGTWYAQMKTRYQVSFNANGGGGTTDSVTATYGAAMPAISNHMTAPAGMHFDGYYDGPTNGTAYYNASNNSVHNWDKTDDTTLYAHWTANSADGVAYAVFNGSTGEFDFIRSTEMHANGSSGAVKSISGGTYTGTICAGFEKQSFWSSPFQKVAASVKTVKFIDTIRPVSCANWFQNMTNCTKMVLDKLDTANVTDMSYMFYGCSSLASLDVSKFDTANVMNMVGMFGNCGSLTSLDVSKFNTSKVMYMVAMFNGCSSITSLDLSDFDTANVTYMNWMFKGCSGLTSLDVSGFDTANVENMEEMFETSSLAKITFGKGFKVSADHESMFTSPGNTFSGKPSDGKWGLGSETASSSKTADELAEYGTTSGALKGTWYAQAETAYSITYNLNGGSISENPTTYYSTSDTITLNNPTRTGYTFAGWTGSNGNTLQTNVTISKGSTGNKTYTANWTAHTGTVTYNANGGVIGTTSKTGWSIAKDGTVLLDGKAYHGVNGPNRGEEAIAYNVQYDLLDADNRTWLNLWREGYHINNAQEWNTAANGSGTVFDEAKTYSAQDIIPSLATTDNAALTVYANWKPNTYTVKFDANNGTGTMTDESMTYDAAKSLTANVYTRKGYTFTGWNTQADGKGTSYADKTSVKNLTSANNGTVTLYAQWVANTYTVSIPKAVKYEGMSVGNVNVSASYDITVKCKTGTFADTIEVSSSTSPMKATGGSADLSVTSDSSQTPLTFTKEGTQQDHVTISGTTTTADKWTGAIQYMVSEK